MTKIRLLYLLLFSSLQWNGVLAQSAYYINVKLNHSSAGVCIVKHTNARGKILVDSTSFNDSVFQIKGVVERYVQNADFIIKIKDPSSSMVIEKCFAINLQNGTISILVSGDSLNYIQIKRNTTDQTIAKFLKTVSKNNDNIKENNKLKKRIGSFCKQFKNDNASTYLLYEYSDLFKETEFLSLFNTLAKVQQKSYYGSLIQEMLDEINLRKTQKGITIPAFYSIGMGGTKVVLDTMFKNSIIVLDFWASWCNPCRAEVKNLIDLYTRYKNNGLSILSISIDKEEEEWLSAIRKDSTYIWPHILANNCFLKNRSSKIDLTKSLDVRGIPQYFLINDKRKVLLRATDIDDLEASIKKILKIKNQ